MRTELFWLLSFFGFAALSLVCGFLVWPQLSAAWPSIQEQIDRFRRLPPLAKVVLLLCVGGLVVYGGGKNVSTNNGEAASSPLVLNGGFRFFTSGEDAASPLAVTEEDIARGWQLWEVRTNCNITYTMPEDAAFATNWWVRGAYEDAKSFDFGSWRFPFGSNSYSSAWAFSWGKVRFALGGTNTEIVAVGAPMSAVPYRSRLWSAVDTNGARVVAWENFALNRDTNTPVNAQVELRTTGDFIVRSNNVETVYRRVDDFDWDGDGISNWSDWDPYWYDGDYTGQEDWWREYVDETVGTGLENGYYKLTVTFPQTDFRRTVLTVGYDEVVVAEPGEYVFLLEKGNEYDIGLAPFVEGASFDAVDDIPEGRGLMMPLMLGRGHWEGKWSRDEGELYLDPPQMGTVGCIMWTPKLCVSPDEWNPSAGDRFETFTALLYDRTDWMEEPTYQWTSANSSVSFGSPAAVTTRATWQMGDFETVSAHLTVSFGYRQLESTLGFTYHDEDDDDPVNSASFWVEDIPDTLFVNNDNDLGGSGPDCDNPQLWDDDIPCGCIRLSSTVPTNGTIRIDNLSGFVGDVYTTGDNGRWELVFAGKTWTVHEATERSYPLYFSASGKSSGYETSQIKVRWIPEVGQEKTYVKRFTAVEPVVEPICTETKQMALNGETRDLVYNPCGVVVGRDANFKIKVEPEDYPDSMITWEADGGGSVQFVGGNHGREVCVRGVSTGDVTLSAKLGNCVSSQPSFSFRVVTNQTIRLSAWIIANKGVQPRSESEIREMVKTANDIFAQVGVTFDVGDRISITNITDAYDINVENEVDERWNFARLLTVGSDGGVVNCYFVNSIIDDSLASEESSVVGLHLPGSLAISCAGSGITLAHELGHEVGMHDVYGKDREGMEVCDFTCWNYGMEDWNGGCNGSGSSGARYYPSGTLHRDIIYRMLMDGRKIGASSGTDITFGAIYGYDEEGGLGDQDTGFFNR